MLLVLRLLLLFDAESDMLPVLDVHVVKVVGRVISHLKDPLDQAEDTHDLNFTYLDARGGFGMGLSSRLSCVPIPGL